MPEYNSVVLPNDKNKLADLLNAQLVALNKAMRDNRGNVNMTENIAILQQGLQNLLKKIFEKKGIITPDETNEVLDAVENTKKSIMEGYYQDSKANLGFLQLLGIIVVAIFIVKLIK